MPSQDQRIAVLEATVGHHESQFVDIRADVRALREDMGRQFAAVRADMNRHFMWLVGLQMATVLAVLAALVNLR